MNMADRFAGEYARPVRFKAKGINHTPWRLREYSL